MKKLPATLKTPITALYMMTLMLSCLPLLLVIVHAPEGAPILRIYQQSLKNTLTNVVPYAAALAIPGILFFNLVLAKWLFEPAE